MPESIFKQVSLDILKLHQQAIRSLTATKCRDECGVRDTVFITLDGRYYVRLPCMGKPPRSETGILLIEDEDGSTRLSQVVDTREIKQKGSLYNRVVSALQRKMQRAKNKFIQLVNARLPEPTPQQGRLTTNSEDFSLSPRGLMKAFYPATHQMGEFAL